MLVSCRSLLQHARKMRFAVPAFNINNLETLHAVMAEAEILRSPVILQTSEGAIEYAGMPYLVAIARIAALAPIPVVLHLDHGRNLLLIKRAIQSGYTSVMFDGSKLHFAQNVRFTKQVVTWAKAKRVSVEAEIGVLSGREDRVNAKRSLLTDPEEAARFAHETACDSLAIAIGTAHGAYKFKKTTHLDLIRLKKISERVSCPLVLHGASGVREDVVKIAEHYGAKLGDARGTLDADIKKAIRLGIAKVNIDTDLRLAFTAGVRESIATMPRVIDPRDLLKPAILLMRAVARQKMRLFGSAGKA